MYFPLNKKHISYGETLRYYMSNTKESFIYGVY